MSELIFYVYHLSRHCRTLQAKLGKYSLKLELRSCKVGKVGGIATFLCIFGLFCVIDCIPFLYIVDDRHSTGECTNTVIFAAVPTTKLPVAAPQ